MDRLWTRRQFGKLGATLALVPVPSRSQVEPRLGLVRVTRGAAFLHAPVSVPAGEVWRYGIIYPFQVAPRLAAAFCNIRKALNPGVDFKLGSDVLLFDSLDAIQRDTAVQISRNHEEPNPNSRPPNEQAVMVKYPVAGAFVPAGAKRPDGSPHPHAGTGFGLSTAQAWPQHDRDLGHNADRIGRRAYPGPQAHEYLELQQLSYDGTRFRAEKAEALVEGRASVGEWFLAGNPIRNGIADGDDLLLPYSCRRGEPAAPERSMVASGVLRFRRTAGLWQPHTFVPVTPEDGSWEPTLVRDVDGALLLCARGKGEPNRTSIRVWRSADGGTTWRLQIETLGVISMSPVSINQAADGTPYPPTSSRCRSGRSATSGRLPTAPPTWPPTSSRCRSGRSATSGTTTAGTKRLEMADGGVSAGGCASAWCCGRSRPTARAWSSRWSPATAARNSDRPRAAAAGTSTIPRR